MVFTPQGEPSFGQDTLEALCRRGFVDRRVQGAVRAYLRQHSQLGSLQGMAEGAAADLLRAHGGPWAVVQQVTGANRPLSGTPDQMRRQAMLRLGEALVTAGLAEGDAVLMAGGIHMVLQNAEKQAAR